MAVLTDLKVIENKFRLGEFSGFHSGVAEALWPHLQESKNPEKFEQVDP